MPKTVWKKFIELVRNVIIVDEVETNLIVIIIHHGCYYAATNQAATTAAN